MKTRSVHYMETVSINVEQDMMSQCTSLPLFSWYKQRLIWNSLASRVWKPGILTPKDLLLNLVIALVMTPIYGKGYFKSSLMGETERHTLLSGLTINPLNLTLKTEKLATWILPDGISKVFGLKYQLLMADVGVQRPLKNLQQPNLQSRS